MLSFGRTPARARSSLRSPLALVLLATVGLSLWLGWQAFAAQRHHREAVSSTLRRYTGMAAWEMSRLAQEGLDWYLHEVFDDADRSRPGDDDGSIRRAMAAAARRHDCECPLLREPIASFRIDFTEGLLTLAPDTFDAGSRDRLLARVAAQQNLEGRRRRGLLYDADPTLGGGGLVTAYALEYDRTGEARTAAGFLTTGEAVGEIVRHWYDNNPLLPPNMGRVESNDSLLLVRVTGPEGIALFSTFEESGGAVGGDGLSEVASQFAFRDLTIEADIPPEAAEYLVAGGLPAPRTGLFLGLIALVLGVGGFGLFQIQRERQLADLRDDFLSGVSHELRTPLAQIRMFAELLTTSRLPADADRARASGVIDREARRLSHLVESVLQFNRLRHSNVESAAPTPLDVGEAIADAVDSFGPLAAARGASIETEVEGDLVIAAERADLRQIVVNLLDNAVKYGPTDEVVRVRAARHGPDVRITVDDQGPGVPPADREVVWEPYVRLDRDRRTPEPGTGIGLAVVASLVSRHGGRCRVREAPGGGARFEVEFPEVERTPRRSPVRLQA